MYLTWQDKSLFGGHYLAEKIKQTVLKENIATYITANRVHSTTRHAQPYTPRSFFAFDFNASKTNKVANVID